MNRLTCGIFVFCLTVAPALAGPVLFQGSFSADNQVALFTFTANSPELITFQTYSYAGGTVNATTFPAGGFAPTAFIFDGLGTVLTLTNGTCGQVGTDPNTLNCDDIYYQNTLGPGTFTLALAVYDNVPAGNFVADGFTQDGNPGFTCQETFTSGSFCDVTAIGLTRTGDYAISFDGADSVSQVGIPEPGSMGLLLAGGALTALLRRLGFKFTAI
jgi:hypothetical protein